MQEALITVWAFLLFVQLVVVACKFVEIEEGIEEGQVGNCK